MEYKNLVAIYEKLEGTTKKLEKADILAELYKESDDLRIVVLLSKGVIFPSGEQELGIAREMIKRVISKVTGASEMEIGQKFKETGDLGSTAEFFVKNKKQMSLGKRKLTVENVFENLRKLPEISGAGSQERKISLIAELLSSSTGREACYIIRTVLGEMRVGVADGIVRDAISKAFEKDKKEIEHAYDIIGDYGIVAEMAQTGDLKADMQIGRPIRSMLAERATDLKSAVEKFEKPAIEIKYDGFRVVIHKDNDKIKVFSRRLEDVTNQFPDIAKWSKENILAKTCIVEGEAVAIDKTERPLPFQTLSKRIQRKYDIEKTVKEVPVQVNLFDLIFYNGKPWMDKPLRERWKRLKEIIKETKKFKLADHIETKDMEKADKFYKESLRLGQEGVVVKNLDAFYQPGRRVGYWLKVKDILEPLDLVVVGAEWGEGKRASYLGSFILAVRSGNDFLETGRMASGLIEKSGSKDLPTMEELTTRLKKLIVSEEGKIVKIKPEIVVEVGYDEIQVSSKYHSGYALRFPRILRIRDDKRPEDANTLKDIEKLFRMQKG